jgi:ferritin-like protein
VGNLTAVTGAVRHTFELSSRTEVAVHAELSRARVQDADGKLPETMTGLLGLDIAF